MPQGLANRMTSLQDHQHHRAAASSPRRQPRRHLVARAAAGSMAQATRNVTLDGVQTVAYVVFGVSGCGKTCVCPHVTRWMPRRCATPAGSRAGNAQITHQELRLQPVCHSWLPGPAARPACTTCGTIGGRRTARESAAHPCTCGCCWRPQVGGPAAGPRDRRGVSGGGRLPPLQQRR